MVFGGGKRDRTADPLLARQVLSQLSYTPMCQVTLTENKCPELNGAILLKTNRGNKNVNSYFYCSCID